MRPRLLLAVMTLAVFLIAGCGSSDSDDSNDFDSLLLTLLINQLDGDGQPATFVLLTDGNDWSIEGTTSADSSTAFPDWPADLDWPAFRADLQALLPEFLSADLSAVSNASEAEAEISEAVDALAGGAASLTWTFGTRDSGATLIINDDDGSAFSFPILSNSFNGSVLNVNQSKREALAEHQDEDRQLGGQALFDANDGDLTGNGELQFTVTIRLREGFTYPTDGGSDTLDSDLNLAITLLVDNWRGEGAPSGGG